MEDMHIEPYLALNQGVFASPSFPSEFNALLNDAHLLHLLATRPHLVLPPGKSLVSVFSSAISPHADPGNSKNALEQKISKMVKDSFWLEVSLSPC